MSSFNRSQFIAAYHEAMAGKLDAPRQAGAAKRGSFRHLCQLYYASTAFTSKDLSTNPGNVGHSTACACNMRTSRLR